MKKTILLMTVMLLIAATSFAQQANPKDSTKAESSEYQTLFSHNGEKPKVSGFGALNLDFGQVSDQFAFNMGLDMAVLFNRSVYFGLYGRGMTSLPAYTINLYNADSNRNYTQESYGMFFHGGFIVGGIFKPTKPIHIGFSTKIGWGAYTIFDKDDYQYYDKDDKESYYKENTWVLAPLMVITPQLDIEMNVNYWFKLRLGVGYQWVSSSTLSYKTIDANNVITEKELFNTSDLSSPTVSIGFVFGWFK